MNDLEGRLQWIEDRFAINDLIVQYSIATDDRDIETLADLYTEDAVFEGSRGTIHGRQAIAEFYRERTAVQGPSFHIPYSHEVHRISATEARGVTLGAVEMALEQRAFWIAMRYLDHYVKGDDGQWRFRERELRQYYAMPLDELSEGLASELRVRWPGATPQPAQIP